MHGKTETIVLLLGSAVLSFALVSCKGDDAQSGDGGGSGAVAKADTVESVADELTTLIESLPGILSTAKDAESAKAAATKIDALGDQLVACLDKLKAFDKPTAEQKAALEAKMGPRMDAMEQKMGPAMAAIMSNQEVATILNEAMSRFGEKTAAMDTVGEAYFGK